MKDLSSIITKFKAQGTIEEIKSLGAGLVNDTYEVNTKGADAPDYVLQRINHVIFQDIEILQSNISAITNHIRKKLVEAGESDINRKMSSLFEAEKGKTRWSDGDNYWRVMVLIPRTETYETINPEYSNYIGEAFGNFQAVLTGTPEALGETIPDFHNMEFRLRQLHKAVAKNTTGWVAEVKYYLDEIEKRADEMYKVECLYRGGKLPKRVYHYDTKVSNMMFDEDGRVLCVTDLDTVIPSFIFFDYGDFLRTGANTGDEDDEDLDRANFNIEIFKAFIRDYLKGVKSFLAQTETENLPYAVALFPCMQRVWFLTDYINGGTYYEIKYPKYNLVRTKAQFKLLQSVETNTPGMIAFIDGCLLS